ncbi:DUF3472 domain-containing protein [Thalassotalea hakodatensis]|uniref:DUF3472 domain-containing protein n=1 Tax=Thalassotalea hakodatensis TaxID=3030492 RepID=UPI00257260E8|nr:DUF3472 domain-containing protein [Thalassotalea hakodatensis]
MMKMKSVYQHVKYCVVGMVCLGMLGACGSSTNKTEKTANQAVVLTTDDLTIEVPIAGNSWIENDIEASDTLITKEGITQWQSEQHQLSTYFYVSKVGKVNLGLKAKTLAGTSTILVELNDQKKRILLSNSIEKIIPIGQFEVVKPGYQKVIITGIETSSEYYPTISQLLIGGEATAGSNYYVKDDFYWGRRGPSVHLQYQLPDEDGSYEWFYSEITVPKGQDTLGSYYMANGFNGGYFGIQVNSETERRVLFSIWSPYQTDDPTTIPEEYKIKLLKKGDDVYTGKFGNEGSGGQSYVKYPWKTGVTYGFLTRYQPRPEENKTDFTAYFYDPQIKEWHLIASFRRPKTTTYLASPYSFLENFIPGAGQFERMAKYGNQWVKSSDKAWEPMLHAKFTYDATARKEARVDYQGGIQGDGFYLKNTGFFSEHTAYKTPFTRKSTQLPPINLEQLP